MMDQLVSEWAAESFMSGPLAADKDATEQVWNAVRGLRQSIGDAKDVRATVCDWAGILLSDAPPLTHNTLAANQVRKAVDALLARLPAANPVTRDPPKLVEDENVSTNSTQE